MDSSRNNKSTKKDMKRKSEENIPFCMKAPSAEHARAHDYDGPCDDGRSGEFYEK